MAALRLRAAEAADIAFIRAIEQRDDYAGFIYRWSQERHEASLADATMRYLIGIDADERPQGFAILRDVGDEGGPYLVRMAVTEPGRGLGRQLLGSVCTLVFAESDTPRLSLDVFEDNPRARALYEGLGFRIDRFSEGPVERPSGEPARLVYMSLMRGAA